MNPKIDYIKNLAAILANQKRTMTFTQLASALNTNGFLTTYHTPYYGGRGVARLVHSVWDSLNIQGDIIHRDLVATTFTNQNGDYAYE